MKAQGLAPLPEWEAETDSFAAPAPVVYSDKACRRCDGVTVEVAPNTRQMGRDNRRHVGTPYVWLVSRRYWCGKCEVISWTRS